ncbi:hypothetical protein K239x_24880 [Planctomycetes bacterium K23_9]|uniref:Uncharacterized protein n=1 Tax=Stieleria marina TaxID=1930275 RepID=A0A517NTT3_9BACT|nr:hypothetical protein K239x_24880 [Planctomycetes bacterium K23_9]
MTRTLTWIPHYAISVTSTVRRRRYLPCSIVSLADHTSTPHSALCVAPSDSSRLVPSVPLWHTVLALQSHFTVSFNVSARFDQRIYDSAGSLICRTNECLILRQVPQMSSRTHCERMPEFTLQAVDALDIFGPPSFVMVDATPLQLRRTMPSTEVRHRVLANGKSIGRTR